MNEPLQAITLPVWKLICEYEDTVEGEWGYHPVKQEPYVEMGFDMTPKHVEVLNKWLTDDRTPRDWLKNCRIPPSLP